AGPLIDFAQRRAITVEPARLAAAEQHAVDDPALADAARGAAQHEAVHGVEFALPLPLRLIDEAVEPLGDAMRGVDRPLGVAEQARRQGAGDRRLLDHVEIADLARERLQPAPLHPRL